MTDALQVVTLIRILIDWRCVQLCIA